MRNPWNLVAIAIVSIIATPAFAQKSNAQIMKDFGAQLLAGAPPKIQSGTAIEKANYAFTSYCDVLAKNKVPVNSNLWTRLQNWAGNGDATRWTCGDHAENIEALFRGMGIKEQMPLISADADSSLPTPNHGAVAISYGGTLYFFDAWQLAVNGNGTYAGASTSKWNGMEAAAWEAEMKKQGYVRFTSDSAHYKPKLRDAARIFTAVPLNLSALPKAQLEITIANLIAQHRELQGQLVALSPMQEVEAIAIRAEQKSLYKDVMRLKAELAKRK
jgi:hypothetical protein